MIRVLLVFLSAVLLVTGCGATTQRPGTEAAANCVAGSATDAPPPKAVDLAVSARPDLVAMLPANIRSKGTLVVATDPTSPPDEFIATGSSEVIGLDPDLANAVGGTLGLRVSLLQITFDGILASVRSGRADVGISGLTDSKEREQTADFVDYFKAGTSTMVRKCNPKGIRATLDLCGKNLGAENGTTQLDSMGDTGSLAKACKDAGRRPPVGLGFPKQTDVNAALQADRIDAYLADSPVVDYALAQNTTAFEKVGGDESVSLYGIAVPRSSGTLKEAIQGAINRLMADGTYQKILRNWGIAGGGITKATVNGA